MASPQGFFVSCRILDWEQSKSWFDKMFEVFGQPGSPNHIETLVVADFAVRNNGMIELIKDTNNVKMLDRIKDYLPKFDYLFVSPSPDGVPLNITSHLSRARHIKSCKDAGILFMKYMQNNNINVPIHWYIMPEGDIADVSFPSDDTNSYISEYTGVMSELIQDRVPEFLWSPYFVAYFMDPHRRDMVIGRLKQILTSNPRLTRLHVQDGVGARSDMNPDYTITYNQTIDEVIAFYNYILVPAAQGTNVENNNRINMEFFVMDQNYNPPPMYFGVEGEQQYRQSKYMQANVPLGVCFEIGYWYGSLYYTRVPRVFGMGTRIAKQTVEQADLIPKVIGVEEASYIKDQSPQSSHIEFGKVIYNYAEKKSIVNLTTDVSSTTVTVPPVVGARYRPAETAIVGAGLVAHPDGSKINTVVQEQRPDGGEQVERHTTVTLTTTEDVRRIPRRDQSHQRI